MGRLQSELEELNETVRMAEKKISEVEARIALTKGLRRGLLAEKGDPLVQACTEVLEVIGWNVHKSESDKQDLWLMSNEETVAIGRVVWTSSQAAFEDLGKLAMSQVAHWCQHRSEPKGIMVVNTLMNNDENPGVETQLADELDAYAQKKNVCLMTTAQLLCIFKEIELGSANKDELRASILSTTGRLPGYSLTPSDALVTA